MARRTPQQWQKLIAEQAASGQTATAFCAARGINNKYFSVQKIKLAAAENRTPATKINSKFIAIATQPLLSPVISLHLGALQLRVPADSPPQWLAALIRELN
ncbi:MAG: hypothetical protein U1F46_10945 [Marinagarivorans sp.]